MCAACTATAKRDMVARTLALLGLLLLLITLSEVAGLKQPQASHKTSKRTSNDIKFAKKSSLSLNSNIIITAAATKAVVTSAAKVASSSDLFARVLGYVMGVGAMTIYTPILFSLIKSKNSDGFSVYTWIFNLLGMTMACLYPLKKGYAVSTYIELIALSVQSLSILSLVCFYQNKVKELAAGLAVYTVVTAAALTNSLSVKALNAIQLLAILICNYANVPQILLTFKTKQAKWSPITAGMSLGGNLIRVFTTLQLTGDKLVLFGYSLGFGTNFLLLMQILFYRYIRK